MPGTVTIEGLKQQPISVGVLIALVIGAWPAVGWFENYHQPFITRVEASQHLEKHLDTLETKVVGIERKVDRNTLTTNDFQKEVRIRMAMSRVENLESRLYTLKRDQADPDLIHEIEEDLDHARKYCNCLLDNRPNCKHLEPGRTR